MITLALDASTYGGDVAVLSGSTLLAESATAMKGADEERLMPAVADTLARAKIDVTAIERVVCGAGPGSFTSLRIAGAIAKGIANGVGCPLFPIPSMALIVGGDPRVRRTIPRRDRCAPQRVLCRRCTRSRPTERSSSESAPDSFPPSDVDARRRGVRRQGHRTVAASRSDRRAAARARRDAPRADACRNRSRRRRELGAGVRAPRRGAGSVGVGARAAIAGGMRAAIAVVTEKDLPADRRDRAGGVHRSMVGEIVS